MLGLDHRIPVVGRSRELALTRGWLETAGRGRGGVLLVSGEAGIGKTRLLQEMADVAIRDGWRVLTGRAYGTDGSPPYLPFDEALRSHVLATAPHDLRAQLSDGAADVALLMPCVQEALPDLPAPRSSNAEWGQHRILESTVTFIAATARSERTGLLLILDDLHWADPPTLRLLQHLARRLTGMPVLLAAAYRDVEIHRTHPLQHTLAELQHDTDVTSLSLRPLSPTDVAALVRTLNRGEVAPAVLEAVATVTEGNPLLVRELVRHLQVEGRSLADAGTADIGWQVPAGIRYLVNGQLARLTPEASSLVQCASVLGDGVSADLLQRITGIEAAGFMDALEEVLHTGILHQRADGYHFTHALMHQALLETVSPVRRQEVHRHAAEALEPLHGEGADCLVRPLALHYRLAGPAVNQGKAVEYALRAADAADAVFAWEEAIVHRQAALDRMKPADLRWRCDVLIRLGISQLHADDRPTARETFQKAAALARLAGSAADLARVALALGGIRIETGAVDDLLVGLLEEAEAVLGPDDQVLRARVAARLALERRLEEAGTGQVGRSVETLALARRTGDPAALRFALMARYLALAEATHIEERRTIVAEMARLGRDSGDVEWTLRVQMYRLLDLAEVGDFVEWDRQIAMHSALTDEVRLPREQHISALFHAMRAMMIGRFGDAERWSRTALEKGQRALSQAAPEIFRTQIFMLRREQGRLAELEEQIRRSVEQAPHHPGPRLLLGLMCIDRGTAGIEEAREHFEHMAAPGFDTLVRGSAWLMFVTHLAELCAAVGDRRRAEALYAMLLPHAALAVSIRPMLVACYGSVARYLGLLAATLGRWDEAIEHFNVAAAMNERMAAWPMLAHTRRDHAEMLITRGRRSDRAQARDLLTRAASAYDEMGMARHAERTRAALSHPSLAGGSAQPDYPDGLTAREVDVLRLLARGRSNREIAADLVVSVRTVENHIASIYGKVGLHGRAAVTAYAIAHRLTERRFE